MYVWVAVATYAAEDTDAPLIAVADTRAQADSELQGLIEATSMAASVDPEFWIAVNASLCYVFADGNIGRASPPAELDEADKITWLLNQAGNA